MELLIEKVNIVNFNSEKYNVTILSDYFISVL